MSFTLAFLCSEKFQFYFNIFFLFSILAGGVAGSLATHLQTLIGSLTNHQTIADYPPVVWTNVASCSDLMVRVRYCQFKQDQYLNIYIALMANYSQTLVNQINFNVSALQPAALYMKGAQLQSVRDCINATMRLNTKRFDYRDLLLYSYPRVARIAADIQGLGDTYCTCDVPGFTTTTTTLSTTTQTTTTSTTTTEEGSTTTEEATTSGPTISPCGIFLIFYISLKFI